eukprot:49275_1
MAATEEKTKTKNWKNLDRMTILDVAEDVIANDILMEFSQALLPNRKHKAIYLEWSSFMFGMQSKYKLKNKFSGQAFGKMMKLDRYLRLDQGKTFPTQIYFNILATSSKAASIISDLKYETIMDKEYKKIEDLNAKLLPIWNSGLKQKIMDMYIKTMALYGFKTTAPANNHNDNKNDDDADTQASTPPPLTPNQQREYQSPSKTPSSQRFNRKFQDLLERDELGSDAKQSDFADYLKLTENEERQLLNDEEARVSVKKNTDAVKWLALLSQIVVRSYQTFNTRFTWRTHGYQLHTLTKHKLLRDILFQIIKMYAPIFCYDPAFKPSVHHLIHHIDTTKSIDEYMKLLLMTSHILLGKFHELFPVDAAFTKRRQFCMDICEFNDTISDALRTLLLL